MSMGGENTAVTTTSSFKSVEHAVEVTAKFKRRLFLVTSVTPISTLKVFLFFLFCFVLSSGGWVKIKLKARLDGAPSQGWVSTVYFEKILIKCRRLALLLNIVINKDGTTKWGNKETKKWENGSGTKKVEKAKKSWNDPASNRRRRWSAGNFWEAREDPTEPAQKKNLGKYVYTHLAPKRPCHSSADRLVPATW